MVAVAVAVEVEVEAEAEAVVVEQASVECDLKKNVVLFKKKKGSVKDVVVQKKRHATVEV